jgi:hypothetical protein
MADRPHVGNPAADRGVGSRAADRPARHLAPQLHYFMFYDDMSFSPQLHYFLFYDDMSFFPNKTIN